MIRLNDEWNQLFRAYEQDHQDPRNQACHKIGIPMIMASIPVGATVLGLPLAATMFTVGWGFQFAGHYFEGKAPSFVSDRRSLLVGALWWFEKQGMPLVDREKGEALTLAPHRGGGLFPRGSRDDEARLVSRARFISHAA